MNVGTCYNYSMYHHGLSRHLCSAKKGTQQTLTVYILHIHVYFFLTQDNKYISRRESNINTTFYASVGTH